MLRVRLKKKLKLESVNRSSENRGAANTRERCRHC